MTHHTSPLSTRPAARSFTAAVAVAAALCGVAVGSTWRDTSAVHAAAAAAPAAAPAAPAIPAGVSSYATVVDQVTPSVVTVRVGKKAQAAPTALPFSDPRFRDFFGRDFDERGGRMRAPRQEGLGSGVIINADGYILTNHHVVDGADRVEVELADRRVLTATVVGDDAPSDLAVLKVQATGLHALPLGDSDKARVGDVVLAIGNPLGVGQTVTSGIISAKGRTTGSGDGSFQDFLQTDAPINHGNSGGALVNLQGELLGVPSQIMSPSGGNIGLGFAIPSNMAKNVMSQLISSGHVRRAKLGVVVQPITADLASSLGLSDVRGALVNQVEPGSPADRAGLKQGDVITELAGRRVSDGNELRNAISNTAPGTSVALKIVRDGRSSDLSAKLEELKASKDDGEERDERGSSTSPGRYGMQVSPLTPDLAREYELPRSVKGVVVTDVDPDGLAAESDVRPNDVIEKVNGHPTTTVAELKTAIEQAGGKPVLVLLHREGHSLFLTLKPARS
ncbi:MAG TPA: DegQ family serine endoprotease [Vicinamibacterales bacterium]|jgi:Do/DeqQ family serine protease|nr:DegQ family serine endoprotease [Vicinamibacterales bacterium]